MKNMTSFMKFAIVVSTSAGISILTASDAKAQIISHTTAPLQTLKNETPKSKPAFTPVATEPVFHGGEQAWMLFLKENLRYPEDALAFNIWGDVTVEFTVEKDGAVKLVHAVTGDQELLAEAERIIALSSGKWKPANQNGFDISFRQKQKINFRLSIAE
jgi:outer membrane biosynthesis protein TonB